MGRQHRNPVLLLIACTLLASAALSTRQAQAQDVDQQQILDLTNADRMAEGIGPLKWDPALAQAAQAHAELMVGASELSHQYPGEPDLVTRVGRQGAHFRSVAENVAVGPSPEVLEQEWMQSAPHKANILDPRMNSLGIGLVKRGSSYYAVEDFTDSVASLGPAEIERKVGALLAQKGIDPSGSSRDARETCEMPHGSAGNSAPKFVMRWEGSDLTRLPDVLEQQIATGRFHSAAVGACDSSQPGQGFTTYHVAVMLY